ncbi:MAG: ATP-binding protein [Treponema sp.]|jgi:anti-sigma regulatory factor (Ser/Thr protein kinase)|nr:ATP-binding protein [Treponema sp.]
MKELKIEAKTENLEVVLDFVNNELNRHNYPPKQQGEIDLAVEEIFLNIANYAYTPGMGEAAIFISVNEKTVIRFEDTGKPYNPLEQKEPDLDKSLSEREIGGLGIFLVKKLMNHVEYQRIQNKNILTISNE